MTPRRKQTKIKRLKNQLYRNLLNNDSSVIINLQKRIDTLKNTEGL